MVNFYEGIQSILTLSKALRSVPFRTMDLFAWTFWPGCGFRKLYLPVSIFFQSKTEKSSHHGRIMTNGSCCQHTYEVKHHSHQKCSSDNCNNMVKRWTKCKHRFLRNTNVLLSKLERQSLTLIFWAKFLIHPQVPLWFRTHI